MKYLLISVFILSSMLAMSRQINDPGLPGEDPDVPVDGGIAILLAAGVVYGLKKIYFKP